MIKKKSTKKKLTKKAQISRAHVKKILQKIVSIFKSGKLPKAIAYTPNPRHNSPMSKWSRLNRLIALLNDTMDARGFDQWIEVGRNVKKKKKAFYIFAPRFRKIADEDEEKEEQINEKLIPYGYNPAPVYRYEDTEGKPLKMPKLPKPNFPLMDVAKKWGIKVEHIFGNDEIYGCYREGNSGKKICMATEQDGVFFHELAHASHHRLIKLGILRKCKKAKSEILAELSAQALSYIEGKEPEKTIANAYHYIKSYIPSGSSVERECIAVLNEVGHILDHILKSKKK